MYGGSQDEVKDGFNIGVGNLSKSGQVGQTVGKGLAFYLKELGVSENSIKWLWKKPVLRSPK